MLILAGGLFLVILWKITGLTLFSGVSYSTVLLDRGGQVLGVGVSEDEQFRFPALEVLPPKYIVALTTFEDKRFFEHRGVDWRALMRAFYQNWKAGKVVSGGSTLSMQLIRISRGNPPRTYAEKFWEILMSYRLEMSYPKYRILQLYAAHAPFGGNIVGLRAASEKYFNRLPAELSWAEAAFLAVLPNAPALRNKEVLKKKRDMLLAGLCRKGWIKEEDYRLALAEPLPEKIYVRPSVAPHLMARACLEHKGEVVRSTIDRRLQRQVNEIVARHSRMLSQNYIHHMAVLVAHIPSGEVRAYVGNSPAGLGSSGNQVDIITSVRSSGSILKPALYALMQQNGYILPSTLVPDIPSRFGRYAPSNFNRHFRGAAPADEALALSLNIPFVRMLKAYNYSRFYEDLKKLGIHSLNRPADDYGLSLILGGAETSLWDLCNLYGGMSSVLRHYTEKDGQYYKGEYDRLRVWKDQKKAELQTCTAAEVPLNASAIWITLKALQKVERPELESGWRNFVSRLDLAWKTGTSFGFRDAWAVGVNADWVIGVWVGNADGEGRPGLVGVRAAAPVLFEVAGLLPVTTTWHEPAEELKDAVVCRKSGYRASVVCEETDTVKVCRAGSRTPVCPFHRWVHLDKTEKWQVNSDCEPVYDIRTCAWFVLPPVQEWYYARVHTVYRRLPPYRPDCTIQEGDMMEMIYPQRGTRVFLPRDFNGEKSKVVFEVAHRHPDTEIYWHIDEEYRGMTSRIHQMELEISEGRHVLTLMDSEGHSLRQVFRVVGKEEK